MTPLLPSILTALAGAAVLVALVALVVLVGRLFGGSEAPRPPLDVDVF